MRLTVIGCGTAVPDPDRVASGYLIETGATRILLDCGPGVVHGLARAGAAWADLTHIALSHFHNDHIGDVPALFFALKYATRPRRAAPLHLIGPPGIGDLVRTLPDALGAHVREPGFPLAITEVAGGDAIPLDGAVLGVFRTRHAEASVAYRIDARGASVGYTGDTGPDDVLAAFMRGVDTLVCECSLPEDEALPSHLTPSSAANMAQSARPGLLLLTHVYPQLDQAALPARVASAGWDGPTRVARDGLVIDI